jgi:DNA-binding HxlR family transcriptional regulator
MKSLQMNTDLRRLVSLVHHRWNILVIAELYRLSGAKFITLVNALDASRGSLRASLEHLVDLGFVGKNTGHGHPMRPEYLLTAQGLAIGEECLTLVKILKRRNELDFAFKKWTLPLVVAIGDRTLRFNELRTSLIDATPRAITMGLKSLLHHGWASRKLIDDFPPTAGYKLQSKGQRILVPASSLCEIH